jgi:hypothetical protein
MADFLVGHVYRPAILAIEMLAVLGVTNSWLSPKAICGLRRGPCGRGVGGFCSGRLLLQSCLFLSGVVAHPLCLGVDFVRLAVWHSMRLAELPLLRRVFLLLLCGPFECVGVI